MFHLFLIWDADLWYFKVLVRIPGSGWLRSALGCGVVHVRPRPHVKMSEGGLRIL
jgi:hypothetical protein